MDKEFVVYMHVNKTSSENGINKKYIGITCQSVNKRWKNGEGYNKNTKNNNKTYFYKAILKYGWDGFEHKILIHGLTKEQAIRWEKKLIKYYQSNDRNYGYNCTDGGESYIPNEEVKLKLRKANLGKKHSEETKRKLSLIFKGCKNPKISMKLIEYYKTHPSQSTGREVSLETRKKQSEAKKGKPSPRKGIKYTPEQVSSLRNKSKLCKKIVCLDTLEVFISQTACAEKLNISHKHICNVCKGTRPHTFGYHFVYLDDFIKNYPNMVDQLIYV